MALAVAFATNADLVLSLAAKAWLGLSIVAVVVPSWGPPAADWIVGWAAPEVGPGTAKAGVDAVRVGGWRSSSLFILCLTANIFK